MRPHWTPRRRNDPSTPPALADDVLAARLRQADAALEAARIAYLDARRAVRPVSAVRETHRALSTAFQEAIAAAAAVEQRHPGTMTDRLGHLRTGHERHLLEDPLGVRLPLTVRPNSRAAFAPRIPGMCFDPADPLGPPTENSLGVDLTAAVDKPRAEYRRRAPSARGSAQAA